MGAKPKKELKEAVTESKAGVATPKDAASVKSADKKGKKRKGKEEPIPEVIEEPPAPEEEEPVVEETQFTETSYTSASFESLPPPPPVLEEPKKKKKKKKETEEQKTSVTEFKWSEESLPVIEEEEEQKPELELQLVLPTKKEEKKKKGKKKKDQVEDIPDFEKPPKWKKMDKKQQAAWLEARIQQWREEQEAIKQAKIANVKAKRAEDAKRRLEQVAQDVNEQDIRKDILYKTCLLLQRFERNIIIFQQEKKIEEQWEQYLKCDGLPDPQVVTQMATYLHLWKEKGEYDDNELEKRCEEALPMLEMLEEFVANSRQYTEELAMNYNEVRLQLREQLGIAIEFASYLALRNLEKKMKWESIKLCTYYREFKGLKLNLWVAVKMPTRLPIKEEVDAKKSPSARLTQSKTKVAASKSDLTGAGGRSAASKALMSKLGLNTEEDKVEEKSDLVELEFPGIKVSMTLPNIIDGSCLTVRASRSLIDLLSESSRSFHMAREVPMRYMNLFEFNERELEKVLKVKKEQDSIRTAFNKMVRERTKELEAYLKANIYAKAEKEKEELEELYLAEPPFMPEPRDACADDNERAFKRFLRGCIGRQRTGELQLRKYRVCGGVLNLDLIETPPQEKRLNFEVFLTTLSLPKAIRFVNYKVQYRAPAPPSPGTTRTPEEIEAEMKKVEAEFEKLALVMIELPREVIWCEPPVVCQWQEARKLWTTNYINDYKYNEDKLTLQFRTGVLWPIGIGVLRYGNHPYQGWDMKPSENGKGVSIIITGVYLTVTFLVIGQSVKLIFVANANTAALRPYYNKKFSVKKIVQIMREAGCDFFPDFDGHNHVEGTCPKEWVMENHLYHTMAFLSKAYNFQWSRWNVQAGYRTAVMQFREAVDKKREAKLQLVAVTPQRAVVLKANEMMQEWDATPMDGLEFFPDLFAMNLSYGSVDARRQTFGMKYKLVETVYQLLQELKLCSFG